MLGKNMEYLTIYILWIIATTIGTACIGLFFAMAQTISNQMLDRNAPVCIIAGIILLCAGAAILGQLQAVALRQHFGRYKGWMSATVGGMLLALLVLVIVQFVGSMSGFYADSLVGRTSIVVGATVFGLIQRQILKKWVANSGWWVFATVIAYDIGNLGSGSMGFGFMQFLLKSSPIDPSIVTLSSARAGYASGLITGCTLIWLIDSTP